MLIKDEYIYIFSGRSINGLLSDLWRFNIEFLTWEYIITNKSPSPRMRSTCKLVTHQGEQKLFLFGGKTINGFDNTSYLLNFQTFNWELLKVSGDIPRPRETPMVEQYKDLIYLTLGD